MATEETLPPESETLQERPFEEEALEEALGSNTTFLEETIEKCLAREPSFGKGLLSIPGKIIHRGSAWLSGAGALGATITGTVMGIRNIFNYGWGRVFPAMEITLAPLWQEVCTYSVTAAVIGITAKYGIERVYDR